MEKTNSAERSARGSILSRSLWAAIIPAILFWSSVKVYGLFSDEFVRPNQYLAQATGDILSIDRYYDVDFSDKKVLEINSSFYNLVFLRDSVALVNFIPNLSIWLDVIFLPAFQMYDDTGTVSTTFPTSVELGLSYYFVKNDDWVVNLSTQGGMEFIPDYNYMANLIYGVFGKVDYRLFEGLLLGLTAGTTDFQSVILEAGCRWRIDIVDILGAFALEGVYKTFKAGFVFRLAPGFSVLLGGNYTLEYNGWLASGGIELSQFKLFESDARAGLAVSYNLVAGPSFTVTLAFDMEKKAPVRKKKPVEDEEE